MSNKVLTSNFNNLYNPIFCNLFNTNDGFMQVSNSTFGDNMTTDPNFSFSNQPSEHKCLEKCKNDDWCTSYLFDTNGYGKEPDGTQFNCIEYTSFPTTIVNNANGINAGYNLSLKYPYNDLSSDQKNNVKLRCINEYLNNTYTPKHPEINFSNCLNIQDQDSSTTNLNLDPKCIYNIYNNMGVKINTIDSALYNGGNLSPKSDPTIDNYGTLFANYTSNKNSLNNILTKLDSEDNEFNNIFKDKNNRLYNEYINSIKDKSEKINSYSDDIEKRIGIENFENENNNNVYKNNAKFIILFIIILLIWYIVIIVK